MFAGSEHIKKHALSFPANGKVFFQPKLSINAPGDRYEQEADAMAEQVMRMPSTHDWVKPMTGLIGQSVQRKCQHCEEEEEKKLMRKENGSGLGMQASPSLVSSINASRGGGAPLAGRTRSFMENAFSADFSRVRVHTDSRASEMSKGINAKAFTTGSDIYFKSGEYQPHTDGGKKLLAHELTHVMQQGIKEYLISRKTINLNDVGRDFNNRNLTMLSGTVGFGATKGKTMDPPTEDTSLPINAFFYLENTSSLPAGTSSPLASPATGASDGITDAGASDMSGAPAAPTTIQPAAKPVGRALIIGGIHGDEGGAIGHSVLGEEFKTELDAHLSSDFDVILVPVVNPGGVADNTRNNRRGVDLNRNFPGLSNAPAASASQQIPPEQPETTAIRSIISILHPARILTLHSKKDPNKTGFFSDPSLGPDRELACEMAIAEFNANAANSVNVPGNLIDKGLCETVYPDQDDVPATDKQSSLGVWASTPTSFGGGGGIPVITHEFGDPLTGKGKHKKRTPLALTGPGRSRDALMTGLRLFLLNHQGNPSQADALLRGGVTPELLTGRIDPTNPHSPTNKLFAAIKAVVMRRFADLNAFYKNNWLPTQPKTSGVTYPPKLTIASPDRGFAHQARIVRSEMHGLTAKSSDIDIQTEILRIMTTRSMPGFSRHHWGTDIDVLSAERTDWITGGKFFNMIPFLQQYPPQFGFFHPYTSGFTGQSGFPSTTQRHYLEEPWHISYFPIANILQTEWANLFQTQGTNPAASTALDSLIADTAKEITKGKKVTPATMERVLRNIGLRDFQTNVAPSP